MTLTNVDRLPSRRLCSSSHVMTTARSVRLSVKNSPERGDQNGTTTYWTTTLNFYTYPVLYICSTLPHYSGNNPRGRGIVSSNGTNKTQKTYVCTYIGNFFLVFGELIYLTPSWLTTNNPPTFSRFYFSPLHRKLPKNNRHFDLSTCRLFSSLSVVPGPPSCHAIGPPHSWIFPHIHV